MNRGVSRKVLDKLKVVVHKPIAKSSKKTLRMKKLVTLFFVLSLFVPIAASADSLTQPQVNAIITLLEVFGVDQSTISIVYSDLAGPVQVSILLFYF
jgi:hypothetical protein